MNAKKVPRGLEALLARTAQAPASVSSLPVDALQPNPYQPRTDTGRRDLEELVQSIRREGVIQPIIVAPRGGRNIIVAGERRWRAAREAGLTEVPVVFREVSDQQMLICALVENVQRTDLSAIEEAKAYDRLREEFGFSLEEIADLVGKSRAHISNLLRLLGLPESVQGLIHHGVLSPGHGKALLALQDMELAERLGKTAAERRLSVRETERLVGELLSPRPRAAGGRRGAHADPVARLAAEMSERFGRRVWIHVRGKGQRQHGRICLAFHSPDDFAELRRALEEALGR